MKKFGRICTLKKILVIYEKLIQKMWCIEKNYMFFNKILQKISSQKSFLWKSENEHKRNTILESFIIVHSFDCDCTHGHD
jgi:hypothetical protein